MKKRIYFLGIGGIGMSGLARYFIHKGCAVAGYDRAASDLTRGLEAQGAQVCYADGVELIPEEFRDPEQTVVVYTPAVSRSHPQFVWFEEHGFEILKRSQMLGIIAEGRYVMAVAGTHGKTSTTTLLAWLNRAVVGGSSAFLGGVSRNFGSNLVLGEGDRLAVEADEFDRSFLRLYPNVAVITSADADHLDIYGTHEAVKEAFAQFAGQIQKGGALVLKLGVELAVENPDIEIFRYSYNTPCDIYAANIEVVEGGYYRYDIVTPDQTIECCRLGVPGWVNVENSVAAVALMWCAARGEGVALDHDKIREGLATFEGVKRRFEFYVNTPTSVYMDDYAHHPRELSAAISSVKNMFKGRHLTAIFQPHLFTRTRDLYIEFAEALSEADRVVLLPIYPAREEPIEGITTQIIADRIDGECVIVERDRLCDYIASIDTDVVVTFGAGDIDACCSELAVRMK